MGPDYIIEQEENRMNEYRKQEIAENAAIISLKTKESLESAVESATNLKNSQEEAISNDSKEVIVTDGYIQFLTPELEDPSSEGLNEQQITKLKNIILEKDLID